MFWKFSFIAFYAFLFRAKDFQFPAAVVVMLLFDRRFKLYKSSVIMCVRIPLDYNTLRT